MTHRILVLAGTALAALVTAPALPIAHAAGARAALSLASARVTLDGTSNVHAFSASTSAVRITRIATAGTGGDVLHEALRPAGLEAFEVAIAAASLQSPKDGIDKNMHKALKADAHPEITFRLRRLEPAAAAADATPLRAVGTLRIAGVEREVTLDLQAQRSDAGLTVTGSTELLMTDYGITPPKAMLGMLKTDPKVRIRFEIVLTPPLA